MITSRHCFSSMRAASTTGYAYNGLDRLTQVTTPSSTVNYGEIRNCVRPYPFVHVVSEDL